MIKRMMSTKRVSVGMAIAVGVVAVGVTAGAAATFISTSGSGSGRATVTCPGGMTRLGHPFDENMSIFGFDPAVRVEIEYTVGDAGYLVEDIDSGAHAGTHIDVPAHFIEGGRTIDDFEADEFVWPAYVIDVRDMELENNQLSERDIRMYEREYGFIRKGSLVIIQTGAEEFFGLSGDGDAYVIDEDDNAQNVDDLFTFDNKGFSGAAVQFLFDERKIDGIGSDAYGPDAANDGLFDATYTALANDGIALVALANVSTMSIRGDVVMASPVNLTDGSGFSVDPVACHGRIRQR